MSSNKLKGFITNKRDRDNLMFLLTAPDLVLKDWHSQADKDDLNYAQELLDSYQAELIMRANEMKIEHKLQKTENYSEALEVINKVK